MKYPVSLVQMLAFEGRCHTKKGYAVESHWETKKPLVIHSQHGPCSKGLTLPPFDSLLFTYSQDTRTENSADLIMILGMI